jgi:mannitol/fructose-specific phosphotransferase system IIA component (Ntr-type)/Kef-type K+ transport system membrane component KefB
MHSEDFFSMQIVFLGLLVLSAHFGAKLSRRLKLGEVVGQVIGGLIVGPILLFLIEHKYPAYREALNSLHFFTFVFLSIIAFGIGEELSRENLKKVGKNAIIICFIQAFTTWILLTGAFLLLGFKPIIALIIGSIGIATAPAATFVIMNKLEIGGKMRSTLGGIVVLDDVIEVIIFSIICQAALLLQAGKEFSFSGLAFPVTKEFIFAFLLGLAIYIVLRLTVERRWLKPKDSTSGSGTVLGPEFLSRLISEMPGPSVEVFIIVAGCVSLGVGLALHWGLPFLIVAISAGLLISNFYTRDVFQSLRVENATSMYTLVFFALIGANANLDAFHPENLIYVAAYVGIRTLGKMGGTWIGCKITKQGKRFTQCLPKLMLPQAGVAAVEAYFVATALGSDGEIVLSVILPGLIIFEIFGILSSERALLKWRSWVTGGGELIGEEELIKEALKNEKVSLTRYLHIECLRVPFKITSKGAAIWELIRTLQSAGFVHNPGEVLEIILERERQGGTTLGDGISILHGRLPYLKEPAVALGILPKDHGVNFGGAKDKPVDIVYMVLSPEKKPKMHLQVLASIARLLSNKEAREKLRNSRDEYAAMNIIRKNS